MEIASIFLRAQFYKSLDNITFDLAVKNLMHINGSLGGVFIYRCASRYRHRLVVFLNFIFLNENLRLLIWTLLKPTSLNDNKPALIQVMAWRRRGDKPLSESMMA